MDQLSKERVESENLARAFAANPELFEFKTNVEDASALKKIGVEIPGKGSMATAYLRLWPEDFIVEEVLLDGNVATIDLPQKVGAESGKGPVTATAVKANLATIGLVRELSRQLGVKETQVGYAGMKDRDAITAQKISISGTTAESVAAIQNPLFFLKDVAHGNPVATGQLRGNRFTLTLRLDPSSSSEAIEKNIAANLKKVREDGFYNYFFTQRFGPPRFGKERLGAALLRGDLDDVVRGYLVEPANGGFSFFDEVRRAAAARYGEWSEMRRLYEPYPSTFRTELLMLEALERTNNSWEAVLASQEQAKMWLLILSSWLFNRALAREIRSENRPVETLPTNLATMLGDEFPRFADDLADLGLEQKHSKNLRLLPFYRASDQRTETVKRPQIHTAKAADGLLMLTFTLDKGSYATAFLSHVVNLATGKPILGMRRDRVDARGILGFGSVAPTADIFQNVVKEKSDELDFGLEGAARGE